MPEGGIEIKRFAVYMGKAHSDRPLSVRFGKWRRAFVPPAAALIESELPTLFKSFRAAAELLERNPKFLKYVARRILRWREHGSHCG
jgi:hypothetical protein